MKFKLLKPNDYKVSNWSGGQTTELVIYPESSNYKSMNFDFRISSATVENKSSTFTPLSGVNRFISPIDANLNLTHEGQPEIILKPFSCHEFSGSIPTSSEGIVTDFNLMCREDVIGKMISANISKISKTFNFDSDVSFVIIYNPLKEVTFIGKENILIGEQDTLIMPSPESFELTCDGNTNLYLCIIKKK